MRINKIAHYFCTFCKLSGNIQSVLWQITDRFTPIICLLTSKEKTVAHSAWKVLGLYGRFLTWTTMAARPRIQRIVADGIRFGISALRGPPSHASKLSKFVRETRCAYSMKKIKNSIGFSPIQTFSNFFFLFFIRFLFLLLFFWFVFWSKC